MQFASFSRFLLILLSSSFIQAAEPNPNKEKTPQVYSKNYAGGIENPHKKYAFGFTSLMQSLRGSPQFKQYCKKGKSNQVKKKLHSIFSRLDSQKRIKGSETMKLIRFFQKSAKKSNAKFRGTPLEFANFLLKKSGMPTFSYKSSVTIKNDVRSLTERPHVFRINYTTENARCLFIPLPTEDDIREQNLSLNDLLKKAIFHQTRNLRRINNLSNELGLPLPSELQDELAQIELAQKEYGSSFIYNLETHFQFHDEKSVPRLLPIYLQRWQDDDVKARKKKYYAYSHMFLIPSSTLDIPLVNDPTKVAHYKLVSMIINRNVESYDDRPTVFHSFAVVLTQKGKKKIWAVHDSERLFKVKHPKKNQYFRFKVRETGGFRDSIYNHACTGANFFFYQFAGFKTVKTPSVELS